MSKEKEKKVIEDEEILEEKKEIEEEKEKKISKWIGINEVNELGCIREEKIDIEKCGGIENEERMEG